MHSNGETAPYAVSAELDADAGCGELLAVMTAERITYNDQAEDNRTRAGFAVCGLLAYANKTGVIGESIETALCDLLNDLHHLADLAGVPWGRASDQCHYDHETNYEG